MLPQEISWDAAEVKYERATPHEIIYRVQHALQHTTDSRAALEVVWFGYTALLDQVDEFVTQFKCERRSTLLWLVAQRNMTRDMLYVLGDEQNHERSMHRLRKHAKDLGDEQLQLVEKLRKHQFEQLFPSEDAIAQQIFKTEEQLRLVMNTMGGEDTPNRETSTL